MRQTYNGDLKIANVILNCIIRNIASVSKGIIVPHSSGLVGQQLHSVYSYILARILRICPETSNQDKDKTYEELLMVLAIFNLGKA